MSSMTSLIKRNLKIFLRDRASVFFSFLAIFIIIGLYVLFLGNNIASSFKEMLGDNSRFIADSWVMAGILSVTSITTTLGAFGIMVEDRSNKILKDFLSAPITRSQISTGYIISSFLIGIIMSLISLVVAEIYIFANGGEFLGLLSLIKLLGVMLLSVFAGSSMVFFMVTFFKSSNAFSSVSTVTGTLIGFLTGIYIPIGNLPSTVQTAIKIFPISHAAALFRQIMMEEPMAESFANAPAEVSESFEQFMGVTFYFGNHELSPLINIIVLAATGAVFLLLGIISMSVKKKS